MFEAAILHQIPFFLRRNFCDEGRQTVRSSERCGDEESRSMQWAIFCRRWPARSHTPMGVRRQRSCLRRERRQWADGCWRWMNGWEMVGLDGLHQIRWVALKWTLLSLWPTSSLDMKHMISARWLATPKLDWNRNQLSHKFGAYMNIIFIIEVDILFLIRQLYRSLIFDSQL